jgi:hypothetical protein
VDTPAAAADADVALAVDRYIESTKDVARVTLDFLALLEPSAETDKVRGLCANILAQQSTSERQQGSSPDEPVKPDEAQAESPLITCPAIQNAVKLKRLL